MDAGMSVEMMYNKIQTSIIRKTLDIAQDQAAQLLQALPPPMKANPPHLGNSIDTYA